MHLRPGPELEKARREVAEYERFKDLAGQVTEVNEAICAVRPAAPGDVPAMMPLPGRKGKKGGPGRARAGEGRRARPARRRGGQGAGLRRCRDGGRRAGDPRRAAAAGRDHAGAAAGRRPRPPGAARSLRPNGHEAVFAGYRDKSFDTVLGLVTVTRAWYHCAACGHGLAPRDAELGVAGEIDVARPGRDERPGRGGRAVRRGRAPAGGTGRGPADGQAGRAGRRGQRRPPSRTPAGTAPR